MDWHCFFEEKKTLHNLYSDRRAGSLCSIGMGSRPELSAIGSETGLLSGSRDNPVPSKTQSAG